MPVQVGDGIMRPVGCGDVRECGRGAWRCGLVAKLMTAPSIALCVRGIGLEVIAVPAVKPAQGNLKLPEWLSVPASSLLARLPARCPRGTRTR